MIDVICQTCNEQFKVYPSRAASAKYCGFGCRPNGKKGHTFDGMPCKKCGKVHRDMTGENNNANSPGVGEKIRQKKAKWFKEHPKWQKGENNNNYGKKASEKCILATILANTGRIKTTEEIKKFSRTMKENGKLKGENNPAKRPEVRRKIALALSDGRLTGENNPNWRGGGSNEPYPFDFGKKIKELIRKRDNYTCQLCGIPECECLTNLHVHHIDYNKENLSEENLISLCNSCHGKCYGHSEEYWKVYWRIYLNCKLFWETRGLS